MIRIYLLSTEHLESGLWFRDEEDFKVAMNYVAIQAALCQEVVVLAFILMSNHVHFVLKGRREVVEAFVNSFKARYSLYLQKKYGVNEFLRRNHVDVKYIPYEDEAVERAIAYVQMNCVAANICAYANQYKWGTGDVFFNPNVVRGKRLGDMTERSVSKLLHSEKQVIPPDWIVGEDGYILPKNYVDVKAVEALFHSPKRMNYFLNSSSKARKRLEADDNLPAFKDQTILTNIPDLCNSLFQKNSFDQLFPDQQREVVKQIRFRFSADPNQIARVCGINYAMAAKMLDSE